MDKPKSKVDNWSVGSLSCIIIGFICWTLYFAVPNFNLGFHKGFPIWIVTFIIGPIGLALSFVSLRKRYSYSFPLLIGNLIMTLSTWLVSLIEIGLFLFPNNYP
jgi:hypothetical protein